jgi:hypothetical protein
MIYDSTQDWNTSITYILPLDHIDYLQINNNLILGLDQNLFSPETELKLIHLTLTNYLVWDVISNHQ